MFYYCVLRQNYCGHNVLSGNKSLALSCSLLNVIRCQTDTCLRCQENPSAHQYKRAIGGAPGQTDAETNGPSGSDVEQQLRSRSPLERCMVAPLTPPTCKRQAPFGGKILSTQRAMSRKPGRVCLSSTRVPAWALIHDPARVLSETIRTSI